jgi:hypothetical protein
LVDAEHRVTARPRKNECPPHHRLILTVDRR